MFKIILAITVYKFICFFRSFFFWNYITLFSINEYIVLCSLLRCCFPTAFSVVGEWCSASEHGTRCSGLGICNICLRFRLNVFPFVVCTRYDLGVFSVGLITTAGFMHLPFWYSWTESSLCKGFKDLLERSYYCFCFNFLSSITFTARRWSVSCGHSWLWAGGRSVLSLLFINNYAEELISFKGVFL